MNDGVTVGSDDSKFVLAGLSAEQVVESRRKFGANILTPPVREPWWKEFLGKFDDPIVRILMIAAVLAIVVGFFSGKPYEGIGIIAAILLATTIAFWNEHKAGKEFEVLNRTSDEKPIKVFRDGQWHEVERKDLVVGDVIQLDTGYEVPADGIVVESVAFQVNEAVLTGEAEPVAKTVNVCADVGWDPRSQKEIPSYVVCRGTWVSEGSALIRIAKVGDGTLWGMMAESISEDVHVATPLDLQLEKLSKWIGVIGFLVAALTFMSLFGRDLITGKVVLDWQQWTFIGILMAAVMIALVMVWLPIFYDLLEMLGVDASVPEWLEAEGVLPWLKSIGIGGAFAAVVGGIAYLLHWLPTAPANWLPAGFGMSVLEYFMIAVTIIVVAVPEGLAMSVTLSLAYSVRRMMKTGTLIRKMSACETIGATTVICSDKTGTLTMNRMCARSFVSECPDSTSCWDDNGFVCQNLGKCRAVLFESIAANSTAQLEKVSGAAPRPIGNPTEGALLLWLDSQGIDYQASRESFKVESRLPFDSKRKFMATIGYSSDGGERRVHMKGAPEYVLGRCAFIFGCDGVEPLDDARKARISQSLEDYQKRGFRTLGLAYRTLDGKLEAEGSESAFSGLVWLRFVAIEDPVRDEVPHALQVCEGAGIEVKMVTGDHPATAQEVARQLGLIGAELSEHEHLTGSQFAQMADDEASVAVRNLRVLSRALPEHKERLVKLLRSRGHVVAVTGDGVNDAQAMKHSNVALSMGSGTDVAKECSQVVLLNDSFATIKSSVMWGRTLYQNIQKFIVFQLTVNVAALGVALLGPFLGVNIPLTVIQLLWVNLIMDTFAALALATEPPHEAVMKAPPRDPDAFIVSGSMFRWILGFGLLFMGVLIGGIFYIKNDGDVTERDLSLFFGVFVMLQFWNLFNARCFGLKESALSGFWRNKGFVLIALVMLIGTIAMVQFGGEMFRTQPLKLLDWVYILAGTSVVLWIGEIIRLVSRKTVPRVAG